MDRAPGPRQPARPRAGAPCSRDAAPAAGSATSAPTSPSVTGWSRAATASVSSTCCRADRRSSGGRRSRAAGRVAHTLAANIDVVFLTHSFGAEPNQRRLERELVLAFDSGAEPAVVLTKADLVD